MNQILDAIKTRRSIRKFKPNMVEQDKIDKIVEAGLYADSLSSESKPCLLY